MNQSSTHPSSSTTTTATLAAPSLPHSTSSSSDLYQTPIFHDTTTTDEKTNDSYDEKKQSIDSNNTQQQPKSTPIYGLDHDDDLSLNNDIIVTSLDTSNTENNNNTAGGSNHMISSPTSPSNNNNISSEVITLISKQGERFNIAKESLMMSELCKTTLEGDKQATEIPLSYIDSDIVIRIIDYLTYHNTIPPRRIVKPITSNNIRDLVDRYDSTFIDTTLENIFKLMLASNYLNIKPLLHLCCTKIATLMKGKTPDQLRSIFQIRSDFTPAEEEEIRREHKDLIGL